MAQDPMLVDQLQIEPGSGDTLLIRRAADGSIEFLDAVVAGGITVKQLAGLQAVGGVKVVGQSGAGAEYTTIQAALDSVPVTAGPLEPYTILVGPGVYNETVNIVRDWVTIIGLGGAVLEPATPTPNGPGAYHTVVVQADLGTIPKHTELRNVTIRNYHDNFACVRVVGGAGSEVAEDGLLLFDVGMEATAPGGNRTLWATSVNHLRMQGGSMGGSSNVAVTRIEECASLVLNGVEGVLAAQLDYDTGGDLPSVSGSFYTVTGCPLLGVGSVLSPPIQSTLVGAGALNILNCGWTSDVQINGDRQLTVVGTALGDLTVNDTATVTLTGSSRDNLTAAAGTVVDEPYAEGSVVFAATTTQAVVLPAEMPDTNYRVVLEYDAATLNQDTAWISPKTTTGFTINFSFNQTLTAYWAVMRKG
jgi:hypothetical protein